MSSSSTKRFKPVDTRTKKKIFYLSLLTKENQETNNSIPKKTYRDNQSSSKTSEQREENTQSNLEDSLLKNKRKNKEIFSIENNKKNKTSEIKDNLKNKQKHINTIHDLSNTTNANKSNKESDN
ncbi:3673_t:CDS:1 [Scutellospora calospora]|uniref:3673_t:CDS:1 n=1 Tax=Scutellospora calospora TaxID=85575 RepID=A0ACA9KR67_9GLOM|nr:3673_t:CDS:1 [Scutellospora calospora]